MRQGSLYPALHWLEKQKLVRADRLTSESGRQARYYSLAKSGRKHLEGETTNWHTVTTAIGWALSMEE